MAFGILALGFFVLFLDVDLRSIIISTGGPLTGLSVLLKVLITIQISTCPRTTSDFPLVVLAARSEKLHACLPTPYVST